MIVLLGLIVCPLARPPICRSKEIKLIVFFSRGHATLALVVSVSRSVGRVLTFFFNCEQILQSKLSATVLSCTMLIF